MKLDIGCGKNKKEGFIGMDQYPMDGVDIVCDIRKTPWKYIKDGQEVEIEADSIEEVHCSHFLEHLTQLERMKFFNELYRVMKAGAKATIITPHWASTRAYGDMTHQWPPVAEMFYYYLSKNWRDTQAPHVDKKWNPEGMDCDFSASWGYTYGPELTVRNQEYIQFALTHYKEAAQDMVATITKDIK